MIWERQFGPDAVNLGYALTGIGISYLEQDKPDNALAPLRRALKIREDTDEVAPADRAETAFALARALWSSSRDRDTARRLAEQARDAYTHTAVSNALAEVERWLRDHPSQQKTL